MKLMRLITNKWMAKPIFASVELGLSEIITDSKIPVKIIDK